MPVIKTEFFLALNQVASERGISAEQVLNSIKAAVFAAYKKDYEVPDDIDETEYSVEINEDSGEMHLFKSGKDVTPPGFGRIAAQTARQVILQQIREAEKKTIVEHYLDQVGGLIKGRVVRYEGRNITVDIGKTEGIMPPEEQIKREDYQLNDSLVLYIKEIREDNFGNSRIILSRSDPRLVKELFAKEVPEIANETVKVHAIAREPGDRTKIAVHSDQQGVDPVGACVGQKGIRVKSVTDELGGTEKIDIIQFIDNDELFIREALSPAVVLSIELDKENKMAKVHVDEEQAPLAIGRNGVNVNLASKLTGYALDIVQDGGKKDEDAEPESDVTEKKEEAPKAKPAKKAKEAVVEEVSSPETTPESDSQEAEA